MTKYRFEWPRIDDVDSEYWITLEGELPRVGDVIDLTGYDFEELMKDEELTEPPDHVDALIVRKVTHYPYGEQAVVYAEPDRETMHAAELESLTDKHVEMGRRYLELAYAVLVAVTAAPEGPISDDDGAALAKILEKHDLLNERIVRAAREAEKIRRAAEQVENSAKKWASASVKGVDS